MAQVTGLTKERMLDIEANAVIGGSVDANGDLILEQNDGDLINAGPVIGPAHEIYIPMKAATDLPSTYPIGITTMTYGSGAAQGFPAALGTVFTYMESVARGWQIVTDKDKKTVWMRVVGQDSWGAFFQLAIIDGDTLTAPKVRLTATGDSYEAGTGHALQIGPDNGENIAFDSNEILARNNGVSKRLYIQNGISQDADTYPPVNPGDNATKKYVDQLVVPQELGTGVDLNTLTTTGAYVQSQNVEAVGGNWPTALAGLLEVAANPGSSMIWQRYTVYNAGASNVAYGSIWHRTCYNGTWSEWFLVRYDTGWKDLTPASGWASTPTSSQEKAQCRRVGDRIVFRGVLSGTLNVNATTAVATVPSGYRSTNPSSFCSVLSTGGYVGWSNTTDAGLLSVHFKSPYASGAVVLELSSISYMVN